jgi:hypothetical protein
VTDDCTTCGQATELCLRSLLPCCPNCHHPDDALPSPVLHGPRYAHSAPDGVPTPPVDQALLAGAPFPPFHSALEQLGTDAAELQDPVALLARLRALEDGQRAINKRLDGLAIVVAASTRRPAIGRAA